MRPFLEGRWIPGAGENAWALPVRICACCICAFASQIFVSLRAMANHNDLADLIAAHRRAADRVFESEMVKLRLTFGQGHR